MMSSEPQSFLADREIKGHMNSAVLTLLAKTLPPAAMASDGQGLRCVANKADMLRQSH